MLHFFPLDDSRTSSNEHFEDEDLEDKHLLSQSSVSEDAIVKEVHRWQTAEAIQNNLVCSLSFILYIVILYSKI